MNDYKLPIIEPTIDYTKVPPINQKRTISFINHFIIHTVTFLNKFALSCEERLFEFENKLQKVEASLELLESWLSSVPGLEQDQQDGKSNNESQENREQEESNESNEKKPEVPVQEQPSKVEESSNEESKEVPHKPDSPETEAQPPSRDPKYEKYFKMLHVGVPRAGVKLKMEQEGLDSSILDEQ